ncbi:CRISPR-associated endonuclease Cas3'' [Bacillus sp. JCM 19034]|uniref:CRISPR-associated endonuclease Cas3'' n=1 Tax=Bacillus sp. JCM 19034 TaxID=1481928 RepID=UPI000780C979|nr:CRISPR-associated endonuclease Cas3'' [Bacillus sp. JCM 19034]
MYIAHVREKDQTIQSLREHLHGVKVLAEQFGEKLGLKHVAGLAGLLHDVGKYSDEFQEYISNATFHPERQNKIRGQVDHSTAGGKLLYSELHQSTSTGYEKQLSEIVSNSIISHHSNLHDYLSPDVESPFLKRVTEKELQGYSQAITRFFEDAMAESEFNTYLAMAVDELKQVTDRTPTQSFFLTNL